MSGTTESAAIATLLIALILMRRHASAWLRSAELTLGRLGRRQGLFVALIGLLALAASATLSLLAECRTRESTMSKTKRAYDLAMYFGASVRHTVN